MSENNPIFRQNLEAIRRNYPRIYEKVVNFNPTPIAQIISSQNGLPNLLFYFSDRPPLIAYNPKDPMLDAKLFLDCIREDEQIVVFIIGLGLGYGPIQVLRERPKLIKLVIVEPWMDIFYYALNLIDLTPLIYSPRVLLHIGEFNDEEFERDISRVAAIYPTRILEFPLGVKVKKDLYESVSRKVFEIANKINAHGITTLNCGEDFFNNRLESYKILRHAYKYGSLKDAAKGIPAIVVSAGPSLNDDIDELRRAQDRAIIISADSALSPLLKNGIKPHIVCTLDFQALNFEKFSPFIDPERQWDFILVAMIKGCPLIHKRFPVEHLVLGFMIDIPHLWVAQVLEENQLAPPAFSVSHVCLGVALLLGAEPIILIGQDLGYTSTTSDHADGTIFSKDFENRPDYITVKGLDGEDIITDRSFLGMKSLFEDIIKANPKKIFINATSKGAYIHGAIRLRLNEVSQLYLQHTKDINSIVFQLKNSLKRYEVSNLISEIDRRINLARESIKKIEKFNKTYKELSYELKKLIDKRPSINSLDELPLNMKLNLHKITQLNLELDSCYELNDSLVELTFKALAENEIHKIKSEELRFQKGILYWLQSELERFKKIEDDRKYYYKLFIQKFNSVLDFLRREKNLIQKLDSEKNNHDTILNLVKLYIDNDIPVLAKKYISLIENDHKSLDILFIKGSIYLQLLDIENAKKYFLKLVELDSTYKEKIAQVLTKEINLWVSVARGLFHFEKNLKKVLTRIKDLLLTEFLEVTPESLINLWEHYKKNVIENSSSDPVKFAEKLSIWEPLKDYLKLEA